MSARGAHTEIRMQFGNDDSSAPTMVVRSVRGWAVITVIAGLSALALVWAGWRVSGGGLFWVGSPSMGMLAPVGSLVATQPVRADQALRVGEVIVFRPGPLYPTPYIHRIYRVLPGPRYMTKGDLNPGPDPWTITRGEIEGTPSVIIPAIGWIYKLSFWLCAGAALLVIASRLARGRVRHWIVIVGPVVLIAPPVIWYRFLVSSYVYGSSRVGRTVSVRLVNTGVLPARFAPAHGQSVYAAPGQEVTVRGVLMAHQARLPSTAEVAMPWWGWTLVALVLLSPLALRRIAVGERPMSAAASSMSLQESWVGSAGSSRHSGQAVEEQLNRLETNAY